MPDARLLQVAEAVATEIQAGSWGQTVEAYTAFVPRFRLKSEDNGLRHLNTLRIPVIVRARDQANASRAITLYTHQAELQFWKLVKAAGQEFDEAAVKALITLVENVENAFNDNHGLTGMPTVKAVGAATDVIWDERFLVEDGVFFSRMTVELQDATR